MELELYGVKFADEQMFHAVRRSLESAMIEGFIPTKEAVQTIKKLTEGTLTVEELGEQFKQREAKKRNLELTL